MIANRIRADNSCLNCSSRFTMRPTSDIILIPQSVVIPLLGYCYSTESGIRVYLSVYQSISTVYIHYITR